MLRRQQSHTLCRLDSLKEAARRTLTIGLWSPSDAGDSPRTARTPSHSSMHAWRLITPDLRLFTPIVYLPYSIAGVPSLKRQMAYRSGVLPPGPSADPEGWKNLPVCETIGKLQSARPASISIHCRVSSRLSLALLGSLTLAMYSSLLLCPYASVDTIRGMLKLTLGAAIVRGQYMHTFTCVPTSIRSSSDRPSVPRLHTRPACAHAEHTRLHTNAAQHDFSRCHGRGGLLARPGPSRFIH